ncbi:hypothetical protein EVAR_70108_1 [Eumeta japonica]|uniref:Uncharacterized protein n=1 Tax=Eumeta variegata TaxID=151549 RepID=A0A4C2A3A0_EUMVA|nr:hypothetical protein EVAR_70108_1 [Eumeta japonica]
MLLLPNLRFVAPPLAASYVPNVSITTACCRQAQNPKRFIRLLCLSPARYAAAGSRHARYCRRCRRPESRDSSPGYSAYPWCTYRHRSLLSNLRIVTPLPGAPCISGAPVAAATTDEPEVRVVFATRPTQERHSACGRRAYTFGCSVML